MVGLGCGARSYTTQPCTTRSTTRSASARCGRSSTTTCRRPADDFRVRRDTASRSTRPSSAAAGCSSRCCAPRAWTRPHTGRGSAPSLDRGLPRSWVTLVELRAGLPRRDAASTLTAEGLAYSPTPIGPVAGLRPASARSMETAYDPAMRTCTMLYRGPLASCNYDCPYCPFAKRRDPPELLRADRADLQRFDRLGRRRPPTGRAVGAVHAVGRGAHPLAGTAPRSSRLSHLPHVARVAIQTNLAARLDWLADAEPAVGWRSGPRITPGRSTRERFLSRCRRSARPRGIRYSVGVVGLPEHYDEARPLRAALPPAVYLWVNAAEGHVYTDAEEAPLDCPRPAVR